MTLPPNSPPAAFAGMVGDGLSVGKQRMALHALAQLNRQIAEHPDFYSLLNRKDGKITLLSVYDPASKTRWDETVKPNAGAAERELLYQRWVRNRRAEVERLSGGKIGYIHVRSMNDASMRTTFEEALGRNISKDAIVVDTRFNGGGNIHEQLSDFLSGKKYFDSLSCGMSQSNTGLLNEWLMNRKPRGECVASSAWRSSSTMAMVERPLARRRASRSPITSPSNSPTFARAPMALPANNPLPTIRLRST